MVTALGDRFPPLKKLSSLAICRITFLTDDSTIPSMVTVYKTFAPSRSNRPQLATNCLSSFDVATATPQELRQFSLQPSASCYPRESAKVLYTKRIMDTVISSAIQSAVKALYGLDTSVELSRPEPKFGDFATNVAMKLAGPTKKRSQDIAAELCARLEDDSNIDSLNIAGPGFINIRISNDNLNKVISGALGSKDYGHNQSLKDKVVVAEYSDPNPFKVLHAGHLYTSLVGDSIANLLEAAGATVHRVNFGGDVGLHVGKSMWAICEALGGENPDELESIKATDRADWMAACYVRGSNAYEDSEETKQEMIDLNKKVYQLHKVGDKDSPLAQIYWTCRQWSYDYFNQFYERIGTKFEKYYPESVTAPVGLKTVQEQLKKGIYEDSKGAVVFKGERFGLHTRVFINSEGLPTYEAKDVGLIIKKYDDYHFDKSVVITGNEITEYMKVVLKSIEQFAPELAQATTHIPHGMVKMSGGQKMSSRKGNILRAEDVLLAATNANKIVSGNDQSETVLGAVKYAFLKQRIGGDIIYEPEDSVALQGDSGPYLQYAHARACNILKKAGAKDLKPGPNQKLETGERQLVVKISEYEEVVAKAASELAPHHVCGYLYSLAQEFNRFYENNRVIGDPRESQRLALVGAYAKVLKSGLLLLGIHAPEKM